MLTSRDAVAPVDHAQRDQVRAGILEPDPDPGPGAAIFERVDDQIVEHLRELARISRGRYYEAADAPGLDEVYERLGSQVSTRAERREITAAFAAGAALLMLSGGAASLRWFGRLP